MGVGRVMSDPFFSKITASCQTHLPGPIFKRREFAIPILSRAKHIFSLYVHAIHLYYALILLSYFSKTATVILLTYLVDTTPSFILIFYFILFVYTYKHLIEISGSNRGNRIDS